MRIGWETAGALVHVDAQNTGEKVLIDSLGVSVFAISSALVSERDIKISVGSEMKVPCIVVIYVLIQLRDEGHLRVRQGLVRVGWRDLEAREAVERPGARRGCGVHRVEQEKVTVGWIPRMEGQSQQTAFAPRTGDAVADVQKERCIRAVQVGYHLDSPELFHDKEPVAVTGRTHQGHRPIEAQPRKRVQGGVLVWFQRERQGGICLASQFAGQNSLQGSGFDQAKSDEKEDPFFNARRHKYPIGTRPYNTVVWEMEVLFGGTLGWVEDWSANILAAVEDGTCLPAGRSCRLEWHLLYAELTAEPSGQSAGQDARLYGRRDARRYAKQIRGGMLKPGSGSPAIRRPAADTPRTTVDFLRRNP